MNMPGSRQGFLLAVSFSIAAHIVGVGFFLSAFAPIPFVLLPEAGERVISISLVRDFPAGRAGDRRAAGNPEIIHEISQSPVREQDPSRPAAPHADMRTPEAHIVQTSNAEERKFQFPTYASLDVYTNGHSAYSVRDASPGKAGRGEARTGASSGPGDSATAPSLVPAYRLNNPPRYPVMARMRGQEGMVLVSAEVNSDGTVGAARVKLSSGHQSLDKSAVEAVSRWVFKPGMKMGVPVAMWVDVPIRFALNE